MSDARDAVLRRIRAALAAGSAGDSGDEEAPRRYRRTADRPRAEMVALFAERVREYRATVHAVDSATLPEAIAAACAERQVRRLVVPPDLPPGWLPSGIEIVPDDGLSPAALDQCHGVLTGCALAIAETGTIVLDSGPSQGRRAITLIPDVHLCVVREEQIVGILPEAMDLLEAAARAGRPITAVSGPSATSDIELQRVEGVHGPRRMTVLLTAAAGS